MFVVYEGVPNVPSCFKNCPAVPAAGTIPLLPVPNKVLISDAVWSAVAPDSIPSNLVPSVATSLPSNVLLVVIAPVIAPPALGNAASAVVPCAAVA